MRDVTPGELIDLGERFGIDVDGSEAEAVCSMVNDALESIDRVYELPIAGQPEAAGERTWHEPESDPLNAVSIACHVPPAADHTGVLEGYSVGIKDIIAVGGVPMQCSSRLMRGFIPAHDATVVSRIRAAGGTITAMTAADEFAGSGSGTTNHIGPVRNPHDESRTAGGSSGGSGVAVATGRVDVALGTDTGGSVRIPASFCGIVGVKPTYGLVPLSGVVENTYTQDHVGPMARSVESAARVLAAIAGADRRDPASLQAAGRDDYRDDDYLDSVRDPPTLADIEVGILAEGFGDGVDAAVEDRTRAAIDELETRGAGVTEVSVPDFEYGVPVKDAVSLTELAAHWRDGAAPVRRGGEIDPAYQAGLSSRRSGSGNLGANYKAKLLAGARLLEADGGQLYTRAQIARDRLRGAFETACAAVDVVAMPTTPATAPRIEEADDPGFAYGRNTRFADVTRLPAVSLPNGTVDGLPVGLQLMGDAFGDGRLLGVAAAVEDALASVE